jgi:hypothetical protein
LRQYMQNLKDHFYDEKILSKFAYNPKEKDCGYRSGLRFLGIEQSEETDLIANEIIYGELAKNHKNINTAKTNFQMELFT